MRRLRSDCRGGSTCSEKPSGWPRDASTSNTCRVNNLRVKSYAKGYLPFMDTTMHKQEVSSRTLPGTSWEIPVNWSSAVATAAAAFDTP